MNESGDIYKPWRTTIQIRNSKLFFYLFLEILKFNLEYIVSFSIFSRWQFFIQCYLYL